MVATTRYEVSTRHCGRKLITRDGPCQGLLEYPQNKWTRITPRPLGLARAKALADAQPFHAVVTIWGTANKMHDNCKPPAVPEGWWPASAHSAQDPK